jgi:hypothetical protein
MKSRVNKFAGYLLIILLLIAANAFSQENILQDKWSYNTAYVMPKGKWESGIFQQFRFGLSEKIELRANALLVPILPNAGIRVNLGTSGGFHFASEHSLSIPSVFLNIMSFKGTGGLISPQYSFGFIASVSNTIIVSKPLGTGSIISADAGIAFAIRGSKPDYQSTIDIPFIYQRMAHWYDGASVRTEVLFKGTIVKNLYYEECARLFLITRPDDNIFFENSGCIMWSTRSSLRIRGGYILSWGKYPFGDHWQMWPTIDFIFGSKIKE